VAADGFSVLITNVDDQLHNHGFLQAGRGLWRLSPAFDLNPVPEPGRAWKTWISEATGPTATVAALMSVTDYFRIPPARARSIPREVGRAVARWRSVGKELGLTKVELEQFADAFEHEESEAARKAAG
jgi:serine/threonine-protein kinase HipA